MIHSTPATTFLIAVEMPKTDLTMDNGSILSFANETEVVAKIEVDCGLVGGVVMGGPLQLGLVVKSEKV